METLLRTKPTVTVGDLRERLEQLPLDMPVMLVTDCNSVTWDGGYVAGFVVVSAKPCTTSMGAEVSAGETLLLCARLSPEWVTLAEVCGFGPVTVLGGPK